MLFFINVDYTIKYNLDFVMRCLNCVRYFTDLIFTFAEKSISSAKTTQSYNVANSVISER